MKKQVVGYCVIVWLMKNISIYMLSAIKVCTVLIRHKKYLLLVAVIGEKTRLKGHNNTLWCVLF